jgi:hypothetical protein
MLVHALICGAVDGSGWISLRSGKTGRSVGQFRFCRFVAMGVSGGHRQSVGMLVSAVAPMAPTGLCRSERSGSPVESSFRTSAGSLPVACPGRVLGL